MFHNYIHEQKMICTMLNDFLGPLSNIIMEYMGIFDEDGLVILPSLNEVRILIDYTVYNMHATGLKTRVRQWFARSFSNTKLALSFNHDLFVTSDTITNIYAWCSVTH